MKNYTEGQVFDELRRRLNPPRGITQAAVAKKLGFSPQFLSDVLNDRRPMTDNLAESLGYRRVTYFVRKRPDDQQEA